MKRVDTYAFATAIGLAGLMGSAALAQQTLVVAGYGGSTERTLREVVIPAFEAMHNVRIEYVAGNSTDSLAKLVAQKDAQQIDVVLMDDGPMQQAVSLGLCATIEGLNADEFETVAAFPEGKASGLGIIGTGLMYNTEIFAANGWDAPTSWNDLKDPKFKGLVVIPPMSNGYGLLTTVMLARVGGGGETNIEPGFEAMKNEVAPNVLAFEPSPAKMTELFQTGGAALSVWGSSRYKSLADTGFPVAFVYPEEGAPVIMTAVCPVAKAEPSPAAQAFVATMLSVETQKLLAEREGFAPVRKGVEFSGSDVMPVGENAANLVAADWLAINPQREAWNTRWVREIEQ